MRQLRGRFIPKLLLVVFLATLFIPSATIAQQEPDKGSLFARKAEVILAQIGENIVSQARKFPAHFAGNPHLSLETGAMFYDRNLKRVFIEFRGNLKFSGKLPSKLTSEDRYLTSDGNLAWDLTLENFKTDGGGISFSFRGDLVISLDKILYDLSKTVVEVGGGIAFKTAAESFLKFVTTTDLGVVAKAVVKTLTGFSKESMAVASAEIIDNARRADKMKVVEVVKGALQSGGMASFLGLTILKCMTGSLAALGGASLGAIVGEVVCPGPVGAFVGAFLGSKITGAIAKTVVYKLAVQFPIDIILSKIAKFQALLDADPKNETAREKVVSYVRFIMKKLKREIDNEDYKTLDHVFDKIGKFGAIDRKYLVPLLKDIQELLRFKLMEEKDWYAAKKMNQMKLLLKDWELTQYFSY